MIFCVIGVMTQIMPRLTPGEPPFLPEFPPLSSAEDSLASGTPLIFRDVTLFDLELIEGVSDQRGLALLERRVEILKTSKKLPSSERHRALELAHGIGAKTAEYLKSYLVLD